MNEDGEKWSGCGSFPRVRSTEVGISAEYDEGIEWDRTPMHSSGRKKLHILNILMSGPDYLYIFPDQILLFEVGFKENDKFINAHQLGI